MDRFVGKVIKWVTNQGKGVNVEKEGKVIAFLKAGADAADKIPGFGALPPSRLAASRWSRCDRYLVEIQMKRGGVKYAAPFAKTIRSQCGN